MEWLRSQMTSGACAGLQGAAAPAFLQVMKRRPEHVFALGQRQAVLRAVHDVSESLLDGVPYDGIADHAMPNVTRGLVEGARKVARQGQKRGDFRQATLVTKLQLLMQVVAVTKGSVLGKEGVEPVQWVRVLHARCRVGGRRPPQ